MTATLDETYWDADEDGYPENNAEGQHEGEGHEVHHGPSSYHIEKTGDEALLDAYDESLANGLGSGRKPGEMFAVQMKWRPPIDGWELWMANLEGRKPKQPRVKTWFCLFPTRSAAKAQVERMRKHPVAGEEVSLFVGKIQWTEEPVPTG